MKTKILHNKFYKIAALLLMLTGLLLAVYMIRVEDELGALPLLLLLAGAAMLFSPKMNFKKR